MKKIISFLLIAILLFSCKENLEQKEEIVSTTSENVDLLPSWNDGKSKQSILDYVKDVTTEGNANFIPVSDRIATFDNDGTLWSEQPAPFQALFTMDRVKALAPEYPEWKTTQPFQSVLENDLEKLISFGEKGLLEILMVTHTGNTAGEFEEIVNKWMATAKHPKLNKPYKELVYQPMLELLDYLRENDFKIFIVSGGGIEFMRAWTESVYGIPKEQVVGSSIKTKYEYNDGNPVIRRLPEINFIDDREGKPEGINRYIGKKPVFASGNSDGDLQMMRWADSNSYPSFQLYLHHTDSTREWAYDREPSISQLDKGLDEAKEKGWTLIDMKTDWKVVYPFEMK